MVLYHISSSNKKGFASRSVTFAILENAQSFSCLTIVGTMGCYNKMVQKEGGHTWKASHINTRGPFNDNAFYWVFDMQE